MEQNAFERREVRRRRRRRNQMLAYLTVIIFIILLAVGIVFGVKEITKLSGQQEESQQSQQEKVEELLRLWPQVCSLDAPAGDAENDTLQMVLEDTHAPQPQEELIRAELNSTMEKLLGMLSDRQRQVLRLHFGMEDGVCYSLAQIGDKLGVSKERARQIEQQAMDKLRTLGADLGLEDFLSDN